MEVAPTVGLVWFLLLGIYIAKSTLDVEIYLPRLEIYIDVHCKYLNARSECNDIVISVYSHYPLDPNAKSSDTKGNTFSIR